MVEKQRRIPCNKAGAYLTECNLRFINDVEPFRERFMRPFRENCVEVFND